MDLSFGEISFDLHIRGAPVLAPRQPLMWRSLHLGLLADADIRHDGENDTGAFLAPLSNIFFAGLSKEGV